MFLSFTVTPASGPYTLSLHDALPISSPSSRNRPTCVPASTLGGRLSCSASSRRSISITPSTVRSGRARSEEHTSELQSLAYLVCRLLLEKKNTNNHLLHSTPSALLRR